jgi:hypothetical protein
MKGFIFTTDVFIGLSLSIIILLAFISYEFESSLPEKKYEKLNYVATDVVNLLSNMRIKGVAYKPSIKQLVSQGVIKGDDMNLTVLDLIGSLWFGGNNSLAVNVSREILQSFNGTCINLTVGTDTIYSSCNSSKVPPNIAVRSKIESGYDVGKPVSGYISRAIATKMTKNNTLVQKGDVISSSVRKPSSGNNNNVVNITYDMKVPSDALLINSLWFIETAYTDNDIQAYINNVFVTGSDGTGSEILNHLNSYLHTGTNRLTTVTMYGGSGYEAGDDGASHFILNYSTADVDTLPSRDTLYFANVVSLTTIQYKKPIFVAGVISGIDVNMSLKARNATLRIEFEGTIYNISLKNVTNGMVFWNSSEISKALNSSNVSFSNFTRKYFWAIVETETYHERENLGTERDIYNTSYVKVNATYDIGSYGYLDLTNVVPVKSFSSQDTGGFYRIASWMFNSTALPLYFDSQLAWLYHTGTDPSQNVIGNGKILFSHPPRPLINDLARFGYTNTTGEIMSGVNYYNLSFGDGYAVNPSDSLTDYTQLIPSQVGYGDVFNSTDAAASDAMSRLTTLMTKYIIPQEITLQNKSITGIRWLWGPSIFEISAWEK